MPKRLWTRDEMILTLALYFQLPFGRLNHTTPEVRELARLMNRTENAVALRLVNFAACDPYIINSGRTGMPGGLSVCMPYWEEFADNKEKLFLEAETISNRIRKQTFEQSLRIDDSQLKGMDRMAYVKQRINQNAFRAMILNNYESRCAITGISVPELLVASHIVPWAVNEKERLNPENGICLSALYDRAFDRGLIMISPDDYKIQLSSALLEYETQDFFDTHFKKIVGKQLILPLEHAPNRNYLAYHRDYIFKGF